MGNPLTDLISGPARKALYYTLGVIALVLTLLPAVTAALGDATPAWLDTARAILVAVAGVLGALAGANIAPTTPDPEPEVYTSTTSDEG